MVLATVPEAPPTTASYYKEPARDFLSGADFGERTEGGWIEIQGKRFVVSVEFLGGRHNASPGDYQLLVLNPLSSKAAFASSLPGIREEFIVTAGTIRVPRFPALPTSS